ncbi:MAG: alpha/beta hydrolase-fold protein [Terriglobales bacterium]
MKIDRVLLTICALPLAAWSQAAPQLHPAPKPAPPPIHRHAASVIVRDATFQSASLGREMKYRIILPAEYGTSGKRYPVLYLLHGLTGHFVDWESRTHLDDYVAGLPLIIAMPEGDDSWYTNSTTQRTILESKMEFGSRPVVRKPYAVNRP